MKGWLLLALCGAVTLSCARRGCGCESDGDRAASHGRSAPGPAKAKRRASTQAPEPSEAEKVKRVLAMYTKACDEGSGLACFYLARTYAAGVGGLPHDPERAEELRKRACKLRIPQACRPFDGGNSSPADTAP